MTTAEYNTCVDEFADRVFRFIVKNTKNDADAQDITQNAFMVLWKNHEKVEFGKARSYLFSVAYNNMIDGIRKMKRISHTDELPEKAANSATQQQAGLKELLDQALNTLPEIQRTVVLLRDYEGYAYQEIAKLTKLTEAQVKVYIFRARKKLKQYLVSINHVL